MEKDNLEQKVQETVTKDILKGFSYFTAAYSKLASGDENAPAYAMSAIECVRKNVGNETAQYLQGIENYISNDISENGVATKKTADLIKSYSSLYNQKFSKAKYSDIETLAKDVGYAGKTPEFMKEHSQESIKSLVEKNKAKFDKEGKTEDPILNAVLKTYEIMNAVILRKADNSIMDLITEQNLAVLNETYKNAQKKKAEDLRIAA